MWARARSLYSSQQKHKAFAAQLTQTCLLQHPQMIAVSSSRRTLPADNSRELLASYARIQRAATVLLLQLLSSAMRSVHIKSCAQLCCRAAVQRKQMSNVSAGSNASHPNTDCWCAFFCLPSHHVYVASTTAAAACCCRWYGRR
jgi:hypothetical protein